MNSTLKNIGVLVNIIFMVCGVLLIVLASITLNEDDDLELIPIFNIVLGCIVIGVSCFGCYAIIRKNVCFMTTYSVLIFILFCLQVALVVCTYKHRNLQNTWNNYVDTAWNNNNAAAGYPMNATQITHTCCGLNDYSDYGGDVPSSCCGTLNAKCEPEVYEQRPGCKEVFGEISVTGTNTLGGTGIGVAIVELIAFMLGIYLTYGLKKSQANNMY